SKGVLHRDLKPLNVMVGAFGEVQVMDWGLAKVLSGAPPEQAGTSAAAGAVTTVRSLDAPGASQPGAVLGTLAYMPPEQARGELDRLDERADVFGLGAVLCAVLTGQPPYLARSTEQLYCAAVMGDLEDAFARLECCGADAE